MIASILSECIGSVTNYFKNKNQPLVALQSDNICKSQSTSLVGNEKIRVLGEQNGEQNFSKIYSKNLRNYAKRNRNTSSSRMDSYTPYSFYLNRSSSCGKTASHAALENISPDVSYSSGQKRGFPFQRCYHPSTDVSKILRLEKPAFCFSRKERALFPSLIQFFGNDLPHGHVFRFSAPPILSSVPPQSSLAPSVTFATPSSLPFEPKSSLSTLSTTNGLHCQTVPKSSSAFPSRDICIDLTVGDSSDVDDNNSSRKSSKLSKEWFQNLCNDINDALASYRQRIHNQEAKIAAQDAVGRTLACEKINCRHQRMAMTTLKQKSRYALHDDDIFINSSLHHFTKELPKVTQNIRDVVRKSLQNIPKVCELVSEFRLHITVRDLETLNGHNWLCDNIINFYMQLIKARSLENQHLPKIGVLSTFFYPKLEQSGFSGVKRWTRLDGLLDKDLIFFPIHRVHERHWCLACADNRVESLTYFDPLGGRRAASIPILKLLLNYLCEEMRDKSNVELDPTKWNLIHSEKHPQQNNGSDCGVFSCTYAEFLSRDNAFLFQQSDMPEIRVRMAYEILTKQLL